MCRARQLPVRRAAQKLCAECELAVGAVVLRERVLRVSAAAMFR